MNVPLGAFLASFAGPLAKRVLAALGIGVISFAAVSAALAAMISAAQTAYNGFPAYAAAFAGLSGLGDALGMIAGALVFRVAYTSLPKLGVLTK